MPEIKRPTQDLLEHIRRKARGAFASVLGRASERPAAPLLPISLKDILRPRELSFLLGFPSVMRFASEAVPLGSGRLLSGAGSLQGPGPRGGPRSLSRPLCICARGWFCATRSAPGAQRDGLGAQPAPEAWESGRDLCAFGFPVRLAGSRG